MLLFFFFQAEDGIRDLTVTGVQTCALPISRCRPARRAHGGDDERGRGGRAGGAGPEGAPVPRRGVSTVGGAPGRDWGGRLSLGARGGRRPPRAGPRGRRPARPDKGRNPLEPRSPPKPYPPSPP